MKNSFRYSICLIVNLLLINATPLFSQDDPYSDHIDPFKFSQQFHPVPPVEQMVTIDGYDNFYLGLSTAEPHGSINPRNPRSHSPAGI